ncbi:MAG TPA: BolA family transcriptional regulator, partial [Alphaproteobacteria bacterium]|nr:BolA family transcriptional regulator [Alphaproteobacteria bacterium]
HRLVMTALKPLLDGPVHALALTTKTPAETQRS